MTTRTAARVAVLVVAVVALAIAGIRAIATSRAELEAADVCNAAELAHTADEMRATLPDPASLSPSIDAAHLRALGCQCHALVARADRADCVARLERVLDVDNAQFAWPTDVDAHLAIPVADAWLARGERERAARLMRAAARAAPDDGAIFDYEIDAVAIAEGPDALEALAATLPPVTSVKHVALANALLDALRPDRALHVLGEPPSNAALRPSWFYTRGRALAALRRSDDVAKNFADAEAAGVPHELAVAQHAAAIAIAELPDPSLPALLDEAMENVTTIHDAEIARFIAYKWLQTARANGDVDEIEKRAKRVHALFPDLDEGPSLAHDEGQGSVVFHAPTTFDGTLLAVREDEPERDPERVAIVHGVAASKITRPSNAPLRWTLVDNDGGARASGIAWPRANASIDVDIDVQFAQSPQTLLAAKSTLDHHKRRVFAILLDSGDWRVVQSLRSRNEMPAIDALLQHGVRATVKSVPATTSAALRTIVFPTSNAPSSSSTRNEAVALSDLGAQLASAAGSDDNPLAGFLWFAPADDTIFATLGAHGRSAANLLFGEGGMQAGHHGDVVERNGSVRHLTLVESRPLTDAELASEPRLKKTAPVQAQLAIREAAALFDTVVDLAHKRDVDVVLARVDATDTIAHVMFADLLRAGQNNNDTYLDGVYAYCDKRIADVMNALDDDDVLVVFSDHGTKTAFEHDERAMFVAWSRTLDAHSAPPVDVGETTMHDVPRSIAALAGVTLDETSDALTHAVTQALPAGAP